MIIFILKNKKTNKEYKIGYKKGAEAIEVDKWRPLYIKVQIEKSEEKNFLSIDAELPEVMDLFRGGWYLKKRCEYGKDFLNRLLRIIGKDKKWEFIKCYEKEDKNKYLF